MAGVVAMSRLVKCAIDVLDRNLPLDPAYGSSCAGEDCGQGPEFDFDFGGAEGVASIAADLAAHEIRHQQRDDKRGCDGCDSRTAGHKREDQKRERDSDRTCKWWRGLRRDGKPVEACGFGGREDDRNGTAAEQSCGDQRQSCRVVT